LLAISAGYADDEITYTAGALPVTGAEANDTAVAIDTLIAANTAVNNAAIAVDTLLKQRRAAVYFVAPVDSARALNPSRFTETDIFRSDGADVPEIMRYKSLTSVSIPLTLSSSLNRLLPYGNVVPSRRLTSVTEPSMAPSASFLSRPFRGGDPVSPVQTAGFALDPIDGFLYEPYPGALTMPELLIFWENGVFRQNTLNLRLTRPLAPNMMLNLFSNYRYFEGMRFNHERNDVANFYRNFHADTATIMNHGYNPLVDERVLGGSLLRTNADSSKLYTAFSYAGLQNEYALNIPAPALDRLHWAQLDRRIYRIDASLLDKAVRSSNANIKTAFISENVESVFTPDTSVGNDEGRSNNFIIGADITLPSNVGFSVEGMVRSVDFFSGVQRFYSDIETGVFYNRNISSGIGNFILDMACGLRICDIFTDSAALACGGTAEASVKFIPTDGMQASLFIETDQYHIMGAQWQMQSQYLGLLLGYQRHSEVDYHSQARYWPGHPPYQQPGHTFIVAPWFSRYRGVSLLSRAMITDAKPYLKASAHLSYLLQPRGMAYTFETEVGFDYWSGRDPVIFAGHYGWNSPIYDLNAKVTAHIKTFRLFYKVDNILNVRQAYVPGYFSPGVTFRWGINWFIL
jgi:hypothetical protein